MNLTVSRSDFMHRAGRTAVLELGPFTFGVDTSDGGLIAFGISLGRWSASWTVDRT